MAPNSKSAPPQPPSPKHEFKQQKHDGKNNLIISVSSDFRSPFAGSPGGGTLPDKALSPSRIR
jgi:hypothetical protein